MPFTTLKKLVFLFFLGAVSHTWSQGPTASITGTVLADSNTGSPIAGATIYLSVQGGPVGGVVAETTSDAEGVFLFEDVPAGAGPGYSLTAAAPGYNSTTLAGIRPSDGSVDTVDIVLTTLSGNSWTVMGMITADSSGGQGIAGASVAFRSAGGQRLVATSDSMGAYAVAMPAQGGSFEMVVSAEGYETYTEMQTVTSDSSVINVILSTDSTVSVNFQHAARYEQPRLSYRHGKLQLGMRDSGRQSASFRLTLYNSRGEILWSTAGALETNGTFSTPLSLNPGVYQWQLQSDYGVKRGRLIAR